MVCQPCWLLEKVYTMDMKLLGRTGVRVSRLCFGTMSFGGDADAQEAARMYKACRDRGINFFDTADQYSTGKSEEILGNLIAGHRDDIILTSKVFNSMGPDVNKRGGNRRHIVRAVEASLKRLKTDRLDVYFLHRWDKEVPLEETLRAMEDLVRAGKIIYPGASNWSAWQIMKGLGIQAKNGWTRLEVIQPMYNLVKRTSEIEIFPMAESEGLGVITYSPVGGGLLSGKYTGDAKTNAGRIVVNAEYSKRYGEPWVHEAAAAFSDFARKKGYHPVSLAVAWTGAHPAVTAPIIGARSLEQLTPSLDSVKIAMTPELHAEIAALVRPPPPATDRLGEV
jgi:aryl-alcohol dehydrogenase-like predicted oxidoreductase